jgi:hypothetical protein
MKLATTAMMAAHWWRRGGSVQAVATGRLDHSAQGRKALKLCWWASNDEEKGWAVAGDDRVVGRSRARGKGLMSGVGLSAEERVRGRKGERG